MKIAVDKLVAGGIAVAIAALTASVVLGLDRPALAAAATTAVAMPPPTGKADLRQPGVKRAQVVFAGGCFWGVQGVFQHIKGVD
ncbi:peptide-methionine (S)-S-oxide reductase, partial [Leclercia adecarboxylata]|uniref:peptide-methionine (S)-S-oxide reductase n=2 Tax=Gammaproteobacteria TaxID=1236 RepID=UPI00234C1D18